MSVVIHPESRNPGKILAIASGKGGTGKTTVSVNLALTAPEPLNFIDCDVEEPNAHLFLKPEIHSSGKTHCRVPVIDEQLCKHCGRCSTACRFNALAVSSRLTMTFPELCHSCGVCSEVCPVGAISERDHETGHCESGRVNGNTDFHQAFLKIGNPKAPPLIREVLKCRSAEKLNLLDCPPGVSCPVVTSVQNADFVLLVAEPTPFGLHDLQLSVELLRNLEPPFALVVNRATSTDSDLRQWCNSEHIDILSQIPDSREVAEHYCRGLNISEQSTEFRGLFEKLWEEILHKLQ